MIEKPIVTITPSIPGRLRVYLSTLPNEPDRFVDSIKGHPGLEEIAITAVTRSVLVHFDPRQVTREEVVMRIALALSLSKGEAPVTVLKRPESEVLTNGAAVTGILTGVALGLQLLTGAAKNRAFERAAAFGTGAAVLQHGWREVRERGYFDPEVLSLTYLVAAILRGDYARGALITWMVTFGRHLAAGGGEGVEIRPMRQESREGESPRYELIVAPGASQQAPLFSLLQSFARYFTAAGGGPGQAGMINELRAVSTAHGETLEGLGWMRHDIPTHFG